MTGPLLTLLNPQSLAAYRAPGYCDDKSLHAVAVRHARSTPKSCAARNRHRHLTYAELVRAVARLTRGLLLICPASRSREQRAAIPTRSSICLSPRARPEHRKASCTATTPCLQRRV